MQDFSDDEEGKEKPGLNRVLEDNAFQMLDHVLGKAKPNVN